MSKFDTTVLSRTDLTANDKVFRLRCKIESRLEYIEGAFMYSERARNLPQLVQKLDEFRAECLTYISRLDIYKLHTHTTDYKEVYNATKEWPDRKTHLEELFKIKQKGSFNNLHDSAFFLKMMAEGSKQGSMQRLKQRLHLELSEAYQKRWYMVFTTLTVNEEHYEAVFEKGSKCWRNFIRNIDREVARQCYKSVRKAAGKDYFRYFAVVEEGGKTGRLHIHALFFMKSICGMSDPNIGRKIPNYNNIRGFCKYWPYGHSEFNPVRFSNNDAFGAIGWRWPCDSDQQPVEGSDIGKISGYLLKYVLKSKRIKIEGEITSWKIRTHKNLGLKKLKILFSTMKAESLFALVAMRKYPKMIELYGEKVSSKLIRNLATKEWIRRNPDSKSLPKDTTLKTLLRSTMKNTPGSRSQSFGGIMMQILANKVTYDGIDDDFDSALIYLERAMPAPVYSTKVSGGKMESRV